MKERVIEEEGLKGTRRQMEGEGGCRRGSVRVVCLNEREIRLDASGEQTRGMGKNFEKLKVTYILAPCEGWDCRKGACVCVGWGSR